MLFCAPLVDLTEIDEFYEIGYRKSEQFDFILTYGKDGEVVSLGNF